MTRRRHALVSATAAALVGSLAFAAPAAAADVAQYPYEPTPGMTISSPFPDYVVEIDCDEFVVDPEWDSLVVEWVPGGSLVVRFTCEPEELDGLPIVESLTDFPGDVALTDSSAPFVTSYALEPNSRILFKLAAADEATQTISFRASTEISDPAGVRIVTETATIPAGDVSVVDFPFDPDGCSLDGASVHSVIEFTVLESGEFTFRVVGVTPLQSSEIIEDALTTYPPNPWGDYVPIIDPQLLLYSTFDPANAAAGFIACNDDSERHDLEFVLDFGMRDSLDRFISPYYSELITDLAPGTYTLVVTTYDEIGELTPNSAAKTEIEPVALSPAEYDATELPEQSATVDFWGPEGGLVLGAQLAATGPDTRGLAALAAFAALFALTGAVVLRRRTA